MTIDRLLNIGAAALIMALLAATWFFGVDPQLAAADKAATERSTVQGINRGHVAALEKLAAEQTQLAGLQTELDTLRVKVPAHLDAPGLIQAVHDIAAETGVLVLELQLGHPLTYPVFDDQPADSRLVAARGSVGPDNFLVVPLDVQVAGPQGNVMDFVHGMQAGTRLMLAHDLAMNPDTRDGAQQADLVELQLSAQAFVLLTDAAPETVADEGGPAPTGGSIPLR